MDKKHCAGCRNNFYNGNNSLGVDECWSLKTAKMVWRIPVGNRERPPYKGKRKVRVPDCWYGEGPNKTHYIKPDALTPEGFWRLL